jgi:hypothetical protein
VSRVAIDVLKERIADRYDIEYVIDVLDIDLEMILDAFEDVLLAKRHEFEELENADDPEEDVY